MLINMNGSSNSDTIAEPRIDQSIARDSELTAAINSHVGAADPHTTYLNTTRGDARYRPLGFNVFTSGNFTNYESQLEIRSSPANASAYLCLHRPGLFSCNLGLGTDSQLRIGGLSYGNNSYVILSEANHGVSGDPHAQYLNKLRADTRYRNAWEVRWNPGNSIGSGAVWQFHHDFQTAKITCSKSLSVASANTWVDLYSAATFSLGRTDTFTEAYWITEYRPSNKITFIPALLSGAYQVIRLNPQSGQISSPVAGALSFDFSIFVPLDIFVE